MSSSLVAAQAISPYAVGGLILGGLLFALVVLLIFGAGREHS